MEATNKAPAPTPTVRSSLSSAVDLGAWVLVALVLLLDGGGRAGVLATALWWRERRHLGLLVSMFRSGLCAAFSGNYKANMEICTGGLRPAGAALCGDGGVRVVLVVQVRRFWLEGGGSGVLPRLRRRQAADLGFGGLGDVPRLTSHRDNGSATGGPLHQLTKHPGAMELLLVRRWRVASSVEAENSEDLVVISFLLGCFLHLFLDSWCLPTSLGVSACLLCNLALC